MTEYFSLKFANSLLFFFLCYQLFSVDIQSAN